MVRRKEKLRNREGLGIFDKLYRVSCKSGWCFFEKILSFPGMSSVHINVASQMLLSTKGKVRF